MKTSNRSLCKLVILLCVLILPACQLRGPRNQRPSSAPTPEAVAAAPVASSPLPPAPASADPAVTALRFETGRNDYTLDLENAPRQFIVYVPGSYNPSRLTPVVIMCHGSNQNGNLMYENTGWVAKAEQEGFIVVFPYSWKYFLTTENRVSEKWNTPALPEITEPGAQLKDDVQFIRLILEQVKATFNVDEKRIFATGFSNGGGFVITRLLVQMNDVFAAFATSGAGLIGEAAAGDIPLTVDASLYSVLGTEDKKIAENQGFSLPFPFQAGEIVNDPNFGSMLLKTTTLLGLDMSYTLQSEGDFNTLTFDKSLSGAGNEYIFRMVRGMGHVYPSGDNNRAGLNVADLFWEFFLRH